MESKTKEEEIYTFKILILGDPTTGKNEFIIRFCDNKFDANSLTIGLDSKIKYLKRGDKKIELHIWDTAGQERFKSIAKNSIKGVDGIILMYDISNHYTFKQIKEWIININDSIDISKIAIIIVGNKCDLPNSERQVDEKSKKIIETKYNIKIYEASAKENINVNECFYALIDRIIELGLGKKKNYNDEEDDNVNERKLKNEEKKRNKNCVGGRGKRKNI